MGQPVRSEAGHWCLLERVWNNSANGERNRHTVGMIANGAMEGMKLYKAPQL